jgi:hypothetical protein
MCLSYKAAKQLVPILFIGLFLILFGSSCANLSVQDCTGDIDQEIFTEDFGTGAEMGPELPPGTTAYTFGSIGGGDYVVTNTTGLNGSSWHQASDHTPGDTNGYCLLFDASSGSEVMYSRLLEDLEPNTHYILSLYVANVVTPSACGGVSIEPNLKISLVHPTWKSEMGAVNTGPIPTTRELSWKRYSIAFVTDSNPKDVLVEITSLAPGGCGSDLAIDDISLAICSG